MLSCGVIIGDGKHFYLEVFLIFGLLYSPSFCNMPFELSIEAGFMVGLKVSASEKIENVQSVCNLISNNCILCQFL